MLEVSHYLFGLVVSLSLLELPLGIVLEKDIALQRNLLQWFLLLSPQVTVVKRLDKVRKLPDELVHL